MPGDLQVLPPEVPLPSTRTPGPDEFTAREEPPSKENQSSRSEGERLGWRNEDLETFMKPLMDRVQDLSKEIVLKDLKIEEMDKQLKLLPDFEAQKAKLLREIEAERKAAEIQNNKAAEAQAEAKALEEENERLKLKAEEAVLSAAKLLELEKVVQELQKPKPSWWQKMFLPNAGS